MKYILSLCVSLLVMNETAIAQRAAGSVAGTVVDGDGKAVPLATVSYRRLAEFTRDSDGRMVRKDAGASGAVVAGKDGSFLISGLYVGRYMICAKGVGLSSLSGCAREATGVIELVLTCNNT